MADFRKHESFAVSFGNKPVLGDPVLGMGIGPIEIGMTSSGERHA